MAARPKTRGGPASAPTQPPTSSEHEHHETPTVLGNPGNFWLYTKKDGFDLTRPVSPTSGFVVPRLTMKTHNTPITIAPRKTAMVIVDMVNLHLSQPWNEINIGHDIEDVLIHTAIPAAREAGIQVVWLIWGFHEADAQSKMLPNVERIWKFNSDGSETGRSIGDDLGMIMVEDGSQVDGGKFLILDQWNTDLHFPLKALEQESALLDLPGMFVVQSHISGISLGKTTLTDQLWDRGIRTLLFGGLNLEFCLLPTLLNANLMGFDTVLLEDCAGTVNGEAGLGTASSMCRTAWGFLSWSDEIWRGWQQYMGSDVVDSTEYTGTGITASIEGLDGEGPLDDAQVRVKKEKGYEVSVCKVS